ncbi:unnamed protein product [marine sediment metagenome]|uniref:Uncharacterized protein n=1 Tax=marine sediment metagenome TaxID=412755 RepID=X1S3G6_9ZZZZ
MGTETDFNLREVTRMLGQQNPEWHVRESVQPVLSVGEFGGLTPAHQPPTGAVGWATVAVAGERPVCLFECRAPGGARIQTEWQPGAIGFFVRWGLLTVATPAITAPIVATDRGPFSNVAASSVITTGTSAGAVFGNDAPIVTFGGAQLLIFAPARNALWVPPGARLWFEVQANNVTSSGSIVWSEIPVAEGGR